MAASLSRALTEEQKVWLVQEFAVFAGTPTEIAEEFTKRFGRELDRRHCQQYDVSNPINHKRLSKKLIDAFELTRTRFLETTTDIAIANKAWRLKELMAHYRTAKNKGNLKKATEILEQAAKEAGDSYTNRRELTGAGGGAIAMETSEKVVNLKSLSMEQLEQLEAIQEALGSDSEAE